MTVRIPCNAGGQGTDRPVRTDRYFAGGPPPLDDELERSHQPPLRIDIARDGRRRRAPPPRRRNRRAAYRASGGRTPGLHPAGRPPAPLAVAAVVLERLADRGAGVLRAASRPASRLVHRPEPTDPSTRRSAGARRTPRRPRPARTRRRAASCRPPGSRPRRRRRRPRRRWCRSGLPGQWGSASASGAMCARGRDACGHTTTR